MPVWRYEYSNHAILCSCVRVSSNIRHFHPRKPYLNVHTCMDRFSTLKRPPMYILRVHIYLVFVFETCVWVNIYVCVCISMVVGVGINLGT